jgi:TPR repeat protein
MKPKPLTFLLSFTFLFFFSGFSIVFADDFQDGLDAYLEKDYETAYKLFAPLAQQGNAISQLHMGMMHDNVHGVPKDYKKAVKWYRLAAEQGNIISQFHMGYMYNNGEGVPQDYKEAVKWYRLAAEQGHASGQFALGVIYSKGQEGVPQDYKEAVKWYRLAAEQGHAPGQFALGVIYSKGQEGVPQNHKEAVKLLLKSVEGKKNIRNIIQGLNSRKVSLVQMIASRNLNVARKAQKLIRTNYHKWHKQIAEQGDSYAQRFLGASYYLGLGVTQDYAEAAKWYKKAAEQEDRVAQKILGAMYEKGKGVSKDFVEAYKWFSISEDTGSERMYKEKIGKQKMTSTQIVEAQKLAREWAEKYQKK